MKNSGGKRKKGLAVILIFGVAAVIIVLSAITAVIVYREFTSVLEKQYNDSAYEVAETARSYLNPDKFADYLRTLEKDGEYGEIEKRLDALIVASDCNFIYVARIDKSDYMTTTYIYDSVNPATGFSRYPLGYTAKDIDPKYVEELKHIMATGGRVEKYLFSPTIWGCTIPGFMVCFSRNMITDCEQCPLIGTQQGR